MSEGKGFYQAASYLGQHKNISRGILKKTACMGKEQRELIGNLEAIKKVWPLIESGEIDNMTVPEMLDKIVMPFIENQGFALWERDVVTDMAIRKGDTSLKEQWKKHRDVTEQDRKEDESAQ
jgi:hypothetical protein